MQALSPKVDLKDAFEEQILDDLKCGKALLIHSHPIPADQCRDLMECDGEACSGCFFRVEFVLTIAYPNPRDPQMGTILRLGCDREAAQRIVSETKPTR